MKRYSLVIVFVVIAFGITAVAVATEKEGIVVELAEGQMRGIAQVSDQVADTAKNLEILMAEKESLEQKLYDDTYEKYKDFYDEEVASMTEEDKVDEWGKKKKAEIREERDQVLKDPKKTKTQKKNAKIIAEAKLKAAKHAARERRRAIREGK